MLALVTWLPALCCAPAGLFDLYAPPGQLPLRVEWGGEVSADGVTMRRLRYTSCLWQGEPIRVYALYGAPAGPGPHPAVLHIHGGTQTASPRDVADLVRRGYACLSYDWTGAAYDRPAAEVTLFPAGLGDLRRLEPDPRWSHVVQVIVAARRAIDLMADRPEVDAGRMGVYGISWGGFSTFLLNALEPRLRCAVPVYCCGWSPVGQEQRDPEDPWHRNFEPYTYAPASLAPLLYASGTNDFSGSPDKIAEIWPLIPVERRLSYTLHSNHHLAAPQAGAVYRFLAEHLQSGPPLPPNPELRLTAAGGFLAAEISAPGAERVVVAVSRGDDPGTQRFWREVVAERAGARFVAERLPIADADETVWVIANAGYGDSELSTVPRVTTAAAEGATETTLTEREVLFDPARGAEGWCESGYVGGPQLYSHRGYAVRSGRIGGHAGAPCVELWQPELPGLPLRIGYHGIADSHRRAVGARALRIELAGGPARIELTAHEDWHPGSQRRWTAVLERTQLEWTTVELPRVTFVSADDGPLDDFARIDYLEFAGGAYETPLRIGRLEWVKA